MFMWNKLWCQLHNIGSSTIPTVERMNTVDAPGRKSSVRADVRGGQKVKINATYFRSPKPKKSTPLGKTTAIT